MQLVGDGRLGHDADGPYNAIHVGAAADTLPQKVWENKEKNLYVLFNWSLPILHICSW